MKKPLLALVLVLAFTGCARVTIKQTEDTNGQRATTFRATTFFDSHNELAKARTTMTDKSQGVSVSGLDQESSGTNATALVNAAVSAAVGAAVKSVVP